MRPDAPAASTVDYRLRAGLELVEQAGMDQELLAEAMSTIHAAAALYLDETLAALPELDLFDRAFLAAGPPAWLPRANLALKYGLVNRDQRRAMLNAEQLLRAHIRGETFRGTLHSVRSYGRFIAAFCRRHTFLSAEDRPASLAVPEDVLRPPAPADRWLDHIARRIGAGRAVLGGILAPVTLVAIAAALALFGALWLWRSWAPQDRAELPTAAIAVSNTPPLTGRGLAPTVPATAAEPPTAELPQPTPEPPTPEPPTAEPPQPTAELPAIGAYPTADPSAAPPPGAARIIGLGGGPGRLHETPSFQSPVLPLALAEGDVVQLLPDVPVSADGVVWRRVAIGAFVGWVPAGNLG